MLFAEAEKIIYCHDADPVSAVLTEMYPDRQHLTWSLGNAPAAAYRVQTELQGKHTHLRVQEARANRDYLFELPFHDEAS